MWIHMLQVGAKCMNIDDFLVYARTGYEMIERRGGYEYLKKYISGRKKILDTGYINYCYFGAFGLCGFLHSVQSSFYRYGGMEGIVSFGFLLWYCRFQSVQRFAVYV